MTDADSTKRCSRCGEVKPLSAFRKRSDRKHLYKSNCRACLAEITANYHRSAAGQKKSREWYERNKSVVSARGARRYAANREKAQEDRQRRYEANKEREDDLTRQWRRANPDKVRTYWRTRRNRENSIVGHHTEEQFRAVCEEQGWTCAYCGGSFEGLRIERDHFVPVARGGTDYIENIVAACRSCNRSKGGRMFYEWLPLLGVRLGRGVAHA